MNSSASGWLVLTRNFVAGFHPQNDNVGFILHVFRKRTEGFTPASESEDRGGIRYG
jgi:hypothetical protein